MENYKYTLVRSLWFGPLSFFTIAALLRAHPQNLAISFVLTIAAILYGHRLQDDYPKIQIWTTPAKKKKIFKEFEAKKAKLAERMALVEEVKEPVQAAPPIKEKLSTAQIEALMDKKINSALDERLQGEGIQNLVFGWLKELGPIEQVQEIAKKGLLLDMMLNEKQVSMLTGKSVRTLQGDRGSLKGIEYHKDGKTVAYRLGDILDYRAERKVKHF